LEKDGNSSAGLDDGRAYISAEQAGLLGLENNRTRIIIWMPLWMALLEITIKPGKLSASSATHAPSR